MYSTQKYYTSTPSTCTGRVASSYLRYPKSSAIRVFEAGLRLKATYKKTLPDKPLVSVVTVTKNRCATLNSAILSVLTQTYDNIEYIVVDGASTDSTQIILMTYGDAIDYILSEEDSGIYAAINKGISLASGDYILVLNDDDWYEPNAIEKLVQAALLNPQEIVTARARVVNKKFEYVNTIPHFPFSGFVYFRCPLRHELMLMPNAVYEDIGFYDESYAIISDLKYFQKLYQNNYRIYMLDDILMSFSNTGKSHNMSALYVERERLLRENFPFLQNVDVNYLATMTNKNYEQCFVLLEKYAYEEYFVSALNDYINAYNHPYIHAHGKNANNKV